MRSAVSQKGKVKYQLDLTHLKESIKHCKGLIPRENNPEISANWTVWEAAKGDGRKDFGTMIEESWHRWWGDE